VLRGLPARIPRTAPSSLLADDAGQPEYSLREQHSKVQYSTVQYSHFDCAQEGKKESLLKVRKREGRKEKAAMERGSG